MGRGEGRRRVLPVVAAGQGRDRVQVDDRLGAAVVQLAVQDVDALGLVLGGDGHDGAFQRHFKLVVDLAAVLVIDADDGGV